MYKVIFWSTPVLFTCVLEAEEIAAMKVHIKLTGGTVEYLSDGMASYADAWNHCIELSQSKHTPDDQV